MEYHGGFSHTDEYNVIKSQENIDYKDSLIFLQMIFPQQHPDYLQDILFKHENILEKAVDELLINNDQEKNQIALNNLFFGNLPKISKIKKRKKHKKTQNIPLDKQNMYNNDPRSAYRLKEYSNSAWDSIIPDIEWLADIFDIPKKQAASICHECSISLPKSIYALLSSDSMIQRMNESFVMLEPDYTNNLDQLRNQFPFLEEHMYERILLSVNNDILKAKCVAAVIHSQNPIDLTYILTQESKRNILSPCLNTSSSGTNNHVSDLDNIFNDTICVKYNLEECEANLSTFIYKRNHAFKEAAKAYKKAKTYRFYADIVTYYSKKGQEYDVKVKLWTLRAKMCTMQSNNPYSIDLHGLTIPEATLFVKKYIAQWWCHEQTLQSNVRTPLEIITGIGLHSKNGCAKLRPVMLHLLNTENWITEELPGKIIVRGHKSDIKHPL
ncbi:hypothetical protein PCANB_000688 [Pneumocystis canis]|nr:hypothetical protein PCK1_000654 [Pneumocystis canis]KAG5437651.1 hypothetical protein PCANB_000688 [Pneumocystis canis]